MNEDIKGKNILIQIALYILIILIIVISGYLVFKIIDKDDTERFTYDSGKIEIIKYLDNNKSELESIVKELYRSKSSLDNPNKNISYVSYRDNNGLSYLEKNPCVQFDFDAQGMLGGQYYGLIYSQESNIYDGKDLFIYNEKKETGEGNNIFIREKILDNWYYYYDDYDGKVDLENLK